MNRLLPESEPLDKQEALDLLQHAQRDPDCLITVIDGLPDPPDGYDYTIADVRQMVEEQL